MKDTRQGNDIKISWSIFKKGGQIFSLEGKNISLYLKSVFGRKELNDFVTTGNIIQWTFYGKDQKNSGKYSLEMVINEGEKGMITTDKCDFVNLVSCSCKLQGGEDAPNVETESIELTSTLEYVSGGGDYDDTALWRALDGKVDKVKGLGLSEENYTTEEKEKLEGLENYDDSGIKEELAKKAEKSEIPTKMSQLEQDVEIGSDYDDTDVKNELARLEREKADKSELTELSAEVSGLSERVNNLPSAESSVFEAVYNVTPYSDIVEAYKANKHCICRYNNMFLSLVKLNYEGNDTAQFAAVVDDTQYAVYCYNNNKWSNSFMKVEKVSNKVTSISQSSNNNEYPSAKAVYDFVNNTLGTIINGDY